MQTASRGTTNTSPFSLARPKRPSLPPTLPQHLAKTEQLLRLQDIHFCLPSALNLTHLGSCRGQVLGKSHRGWTLSSASPGATQSRLSEDLGNLGGKAGSRSSRTRGYNLAAKGGHSASGPCSTTASITGSGFTTQPQTRCSP